MTNIDVEAKTVFIPQYKDKLPADIIEVQAGIDKLPETTLNSNEWGKAEKILKYRLRDQDDIWRDFIA